MPASYLPPELRPFEGTPSPMQTGDVRCPCGNEHEFDGVDHRGEPGRPDYSGQVLTLWQRFTVEDGEPIYYASHEGGDSGANIGD